MTNASSSSLYIGLMSGTSMDGVDAALVDVATHQCIYGITRPYSTDAENGLRHILDSNSVALQKIPQLNTILGKEFANAVTELLERANYSASQITAIGSHGQTVCHNTKDNLPYTLQLACPHTIAQMTGIPVVADFRTRDMVVGGQGAPFAPLYHREIFADSTKSIFVVNIGGIANITYLHPSSSVIGFDIGPGNCLMDAWIQKCKGHFYDANGNWAQQGRVIDNLLANLLQDPFFSLSPPKSIGKEYFSLAWLNEKLQKEYTNEDIQATLLELTANSISQSISQLKKTDDPVLLCGGGVHNLALVTLLQSKLPQNPVMSTSEYGINPDYLEAMMFAWLAKQTITGVKLDLSSITGAHIPVLLGAIYPV